MGKVIRFEDGTEIVPDAQGARQEALDLSLWTLPPDNGSVVITTFPPDWRRD